jgi:hypothetical protein
VVFDDASLVNPSFAADVLGDYVIELVVNDGRRASEPASHTVTAAEPAPDGGVRDGGASDGGVDGGLLDAGTDAATDAAVSPGTMDLLSCACVGAPPGLFTTLCADLPTCTAGMPAPDGSCDSVCSGGTVSSSCEPDSMLCR